MSKNKSAALAIAIASAISASSFTSAAWAGPNDFFGSQPYMPGAVGSLDGPSDTPSGSLLGGSSSSPAQASPQPTAPSPSPGGFPGAGTDNTADEKRMQRKYKANISYFKDLIAKGESMMEKAPNKDDKMYKKGRILKETGEKHLQELQTSSPFQIDPTLAVEGEKKTKKDKHKNGKSDT